MAESHDRPEPTDEERGGLDWVADVGSDWWATILGLAIAALAVVGALPRIPW